MVGSYKVAGVARSRARASATIGGPKGGDRHLRMPQQRDTAFLGLGQLGRILIIGTLGFGAPDGLRRGASGGRAHLDRDDVAIQKACCACQRNVNDRVCPSIPPQFALAPDDLTTAPHFSVSSATNLPSSSDEPGNAMVPRSASRAFILL